MTARATRAPGGAAAEGAAVLPLRRVGWRAGWQEAVLQGRGAEGGDAFGSDQKCRQGRIQAGGGAPPDSGTAQPTYICISIKIRLDSDICQIGSEVYLI